MQSLSNVCNSPLLDTAHECSSGSGHISKEKPQCNDSEQETLDTCGTDLQKSCYKSWHKNQNKLWSNHTCKISCKKWKGIKLLWRKYFCRMQYNMVIMQIFSSPFNLIVISNEIMEQGMWSLFQGWPWNTVCKWTIANIMLINNHELIPDKHSVQNSYLIPK